MKEIINWLAATHTHTQRLTHPERRRIHTHSLLRAERERNKLPAHDLPRWAKEDISEAVYRKDYKNPLHPQFFFRNSKNMRKKWAR